MELKKRKQAEAFRATPGKGLPRKKLVEFEKGPAFNDGGSHADDVFGGHLAVDDGQVRHACKGCQCGESKLGCVWTKGEHAFAVEHPSDGCEVEAACELSVDVDGYAVGDPLSVEGLPHVNHVPSHPGAVRALPGDIRQWPQSPRQSRSRGEFQAQVPNSVDGRRHGRAFSWNE